MKKRIITVALCMALLGVSTGCSLLENLKVANDPSLKEWKLVEDSAEGSKVVMYVSGDDPKRIEWLNDSFKPYLKTNKDIELIVETLDFERTIQQLKTEKNNQVLIGDIDLVLLPDTGFKRGYDNGLWYGPFVQDMPLLKDIVDPKNLMFGYEEGIAANGYTLPIGQEQLVMIYDRDVFFDAPTNWATFFEAIKEYKGTFTYPDPRLSRVGEAFILSYLLQGEHLEDYMTTPLDKAKVKAALQSKLTVLKDIKPLMYDKGMTLPQSVAEMDQMFFDGKLLFSMSMSYNHATEKLADYEYPEGAFSYVFDEGTLSYNANMVIAHNAPNKSGAMVVLQTLLESEMQVSKYDPKKYGELPVYTPSVIGTETMKLFKGVKLKSTSVKADDLLEKRISELPKVNRDLLIKLWEEVVFSSGSK